MKSKKPRNNKPAKQGEAPEKKRTRILQIILAVFSILLILSMVLSAIATF